jgi:hypothetical protein
MSGFDSADLGHQQVGSNLRDNGRDVEIAAEAATDSEAEEFQNCRLFGQCTCALIQDEHNAPSPGAVGQLMFRA